MTEEQVAELQPWLRENAMPGTAVGSGWTNKAVRAQVAEKFQVTYSKSGMRKLFARLGGVINAGVNSISGGQQKTKRAMSGKRARPWPAWRKVVSRSCRWRAIRVKCIWKERWADGGTPLESSL